MTEPDAQERAFREAIDCRFPYDDEPAWQELVARGHALSLDAACHVLREIVQPPRSRASSVDRKLAMIDAWLAMAVHPLLIELGGVARDAVQGDRLGTDEALRLLAKISREPDLFGALIVVAAACEDFGFEAIEVRSDAIIEDWAQRRAISP